jgi:tetraacyldisaccharide 4'-kinase
MNSGGLRALLLPLAWGYGAGMRLRAWLYRRGIFRAHRLDGIVISVGNLTLGGTGKTPLVAWLAARLADAGNRVGVLMRGYRGHGGISDEAELLRARLGDRVRLGIGANRYRKGRELARSGVNCFVLDDGFQHLALARDVDIVLIDALDPFGAGLLPVGRRREPKAALRRADLVIITRSAHAPAVEAVVRRFTDAPIFYASTELEKVVPAANSAVEAGAADWFGRRVFAFCGIGNPQAFFEDVQRWGMELAGGMVFRDHHRYTPRDGLRIEQAALATGAEALVTTEKDVYNLRAVYFVRLPVYFCRIALRLAEAEKFWEVLEAIVEMKRSRSQ